MSNDVGGGIGNLLVTKSNSIAAPSPTCWFEEENCTNCGTVEVSKIILFAICYFKIYPTDYKSII